jgi:hypothetical protein
MNPTLKRGIPSSLSCAEKLADLRLADWDNIDICGFAICGLKKKMRIGSLRTSTSKKLADYDSREREH